MAYDKKLHLISGFLISVVAGFCFKDAGCGLAFAVLAGILKEAIDWCVYHGFDKVDMVFTWIGGLLGCLAYMAVKGVL